MTQKQNDILSGMRPTSQNTGSRETRSMRARAHGSSQSTHKKMIENSTRQFVSEARRRREFCCK